VQGHDHGPGKDARAAIDPKIFPQLAHQRSAVPQALPLTIAGNSLAVRAHYASNHFGCALVLQAGWSNLAR
jgi:hypothetical protein